MDMAELKWWQKAVFYQIYPRSFADANGDGIGDFKGMVARLDHITSLGVDAIWLSPHFPSPLWDCGYDISDYEAIAPEYGTIDDFQEFLGLAHSRGLRVILDLVLNHTSDEHPWFQESKSSRDNPRADWYIWEDRPPNNWQSCFDGPAWTYAEEREQYFYHYFMKQQPDLNWNNPKVKQAMWKAVRFWLDMGVDGFRLDAIGTIFEHPDRPNHPVPMNLAELRHFSHYAHTPREKALAGKYWFNMFKYQWGQPHELMKELRSILDEYPGDRMLIGEDDHISYYGNGTDELHMVFNFPLMRTSRITPNWVRKNQKSRLSSLAKISEDAWACNTLGNHDSPRAYGNYGDGEHHAEYARLNIALLLTLRGTPFLYYGEEIGMTDLQILDPNLLRDTMATWYYRALIDELHISEKDAASQASKMTRDKSRTPMQWENSINAGFCPAEVQPWLPINNNYAQGINVIEQERDPLSLLNFYRRILSVRKKTPGLIAGDYHPMHLRANDYLAFLRRIPKQTILVVLNYSSKPLNLRFSFPGHKKISRSIFSSTQRGNHLDQLSRLHIAPYEIYIAYVLESSG